MCDDETNSLVFNLYICSTRCFFKKCHLQCTPWHIIEYEHLKINMYVHVYEYIYI